MRECRRKRTHINQVHYKAFVGRRTQWRYNRHTTRLMHRTNRLTLYQVVLLKLRQILCATVKQGARCWRTVHENIRVLDVMQKISWGLQICFDQIISTLAYFCKFINSCISKYYHSLKKFLIILFIWCYFFIYI